MKKLLLYGILVLTLAGCASSPPKPEARLRRSNVIAEKAFIYGVNIGFQLANESRTNQTINYPVRAYQIKNEMIRSQDTNGVFNGLDFQTNTWTFGS